MKPTGIRDEAAWLNSNGAVVLPTRLDNPKAPSVPWTPLYDRYLNQHQQHEQAVELFTNEEPGGIAILNIRGWWCFDFDGKARPDSNGKEPVGAEPVEAFCNALGLDFGTYQWIVRSPSDGWHVWVRCFNDERERAGGAVSYEAKEEFNTLGAVEWRAGSCITIAPPTQAKGSSYRFHNIERPTAPPTVVDVDNVHKAFDRVATVATKEHGARSTRRTGKERVEHLLRDGSEPMEVARAVFPLLEYACGVVARRLNMEPENVPMVLKYRRGKQAEWRIAEGLGAGGWFVEEDEQRWNAFGLDWGGDFLELISMDEFGKSYSIPNGQPGALTPQERKHVHGIVESNTDVVLSTKPQVEAVASDVQAPVVVEVAGKPKERKRKESQGFGIPQQVRDFVAQNGWQLRYNIITKHLEWTHQGEETWRHLDNRQRADWNTAFEEYQGKYIGEGRFEQYIKGKHIAPDFDPIHSYFDSLEPWDGEDHIGTLASTLETEKPKLFDKHLRKWLVGTFACGYHTARYHVNELFLILQSPGQGLYKTTWLQKLVPSKLQEHLFTTAITDSKDSEHQQSQAWIMLNDELDTMRKTAHSHLKMVLSKRSYNFRKAYDRDIEIHYRRVSFCGSTNDDEFLVDPTGNRRYLCHAIKNVEPWWLDDYTGEEVNIHKVWAQVKALFEQGFKYYLSKEEIRELETNNTPFLKKTYVDELVERYIRPAIPNTDGALFLTTSLLAERLTLAYDSDNKTPLNENNALRRPDPDAIHRRLGGALRAQGYTRENRWDKTRAQAVYGYWVQFVTPAKPEDELEPGVLPF